MARVRTTEELREYWNKFAENYENYLTKTTILVNNLLIALLNLSPEHIVAECGCGSGSGIELLLNHCPNLSQILANDISEDILQIAQRKNFPRTTYVIANNESLPYESNYCDRYISNLSLQIVESPANMLLEAHRILKPGGLAIFSVWGKMEESNYYNHLKKCLVATGYEIPNEPNLFHLNNQEELNQMVRDAGSSEHWSVSSDQDKGSRIPQGPIIHLYCESNTIEDMVKIVCINPDNILMKDKDPEMFARLLNNVREEFSRVWNSGSAITFDFLVVQGEKRLV